jgi:hypothetical protein
MKNITMIQQQDARPYSVINMTTLDVPNPKSKQVTTEQRPCCLSVPIVAG